jgi:hypothetical protein
MIWPMGYYQGHCETGLMPAGDRGVTSGMCLTCRSRPRSLERWLYPLEAGASLQFR